MTPTGALDGIRVIEVGTLISGPFAGRLLGDMGAEVIKIEPPGSPDPVRTWGQAELDGHHFFWTVHARNKKAVTLNLREPQGRELFLKLVERSDIIVENFRPGTLEKWGLGYDVLRQHNRGIILVRVSGYGQTGPDAHKAGYASVAEAASCGGLNQSCCGGVSCSGGLICAGGTCQQPSCFDGIANNNEASGPPTVIQKICRLERAATSSRW